MVSKEVADNFYSRIEEIDGKFYKKREVYPPFDREGKIKWKNFLIGNWKTLLISIFIVVVTLGFIKEYASNLAFCREYLGAFNTHNFTKILNLTNTTFP